MIPVKYISNIEHIDDLARKIRGLLEISWAASDNNRYSVIHLPDAQLAIHDLSEELISSIGTLYGEVEHEDTNK